MKPMQYMMLVAGISILSVIGACSTTPDQNNIASDEGVKFNLSQCDLLNNEFHCQLTMTSEKQNASVEIKDETQLEDDQGNKYPLTAGNVANQEIKNDMYAKAQKELTAGSPINATFIFQNIATDAKAIKELTIVGRVKAHNNTLWENFKVSLEAPQVEK